MKKAIKFIGILMIISASLMVGLTNSQSLNDKNLCIENLITISTANAEGGFDGIWRVTILSISSWRCDSGGSKCCLDFDC